MDWKLQAALQFVSALALYIIVPLRHICFNHDGIATASLLAAAAAIAITMGVTYEWKSGWCASLCPIHPVERLYGQNVLVSLPNAHCTSCVNCSVPCPDSTPNFHPAISNKSFFQKAASLMIIGGLPGFIWGWFHTPDHQGPFQWQVVLEAYLPPLMGMTVSIISYSVLKKMIAPKHKRTLISLFAALGVSCYYWYRIPSLFGFGLYKDDGCLIDLTQFLPHWMIQAAPVLTTCFFLWWFLARKPTKNNWLVRPAWAPALSKKQERDKAELFHENLRTISSK